MKIEAPFGQNCTGRPVCFRVTDCVDFDSITWTILYAPQGAGEGSPTAPEIVHLGEGLFQITAAPNNPGSYVIEGECCP